MLASVLLQKPRDPAQHMLNWLWQSDPRKAAAAARQRAAELEKEAQGWWELASKLDENMERRRLQKELEQLRAERTLLLQTLATQADSRMTAHAGEEVKPAAKPHGAVDSPKAEPIQRPSAESVGNNAAMLRKLLIGKADGSSSSSENENESAERSTKEFEEKPDSARYHATAPGDVLQNTMSWWQQQQQRKVPATTTSGIESAREAPAAEIQEEVSTLTWWQQQQRKAQATIDSTKATVEHALEERQRKQEAEWCQLVMITPDGAQPRFKPFQDWCDIFEGSKAEAKKAEEKSQNSMREEQTKKKESTFLERACKHAEEKARQSLFCAVEKSITNTIMKLTLEVCSKVCTPVELKLTAQQNAADVARVLNAINGIVLTYRFGEAGSCHKKFKYIRSVAAVQFVSTIEALFAEAEKHGLDPDARVQELDHLVTREIFAKREDVRQIIHDLPFLRVGSPEFGEALGKALETRMPTVVGDGAYRLLTEAHSMAATMELTQESHSQQKAMSGFHVWSVESGSQVLISSDGSSATYAGENGDEMFGLVMGNGIIPVVPEGKYFEVCIESKRPGVTEDGMVIGVTSIAPTDVAQVPETADALGDAGNIWVIGYDGQFFDGEWLDLDWNPATIKVGDYVGLLLTPAGGMEVHVNGNAVVKVNVSIPSECILYPVFDFLFAVISCSWRPGARPGGFSKQSEAPKDSLAGKLHAGKKAVDELDQGALEMQMILRSFVLAEMDSFFPEVVAQVKRLLIFAKDLYVEIQLRRKELEKKKDVAMKGIKDPPQVVVEETQRLYEQTYHKISRYVGQLMGMLRPMLETQPEEDCNLLSS
eukprot:gnl/MRDRNA2_/MRDRNA2_142632_c0_seq1.p1 gnl/MRDRNA2_/MRDRNA2_142632_c0~~gnl/MRDRNA2_/MRDRNA2_142632_c0_seq1.p1  ORF type:complete len:826 (+),score=217.77 gnl/MRDRNA2_/MRDRNA2_142632_c0_seq1:2-2479(+)